MTAATPVSIGQNFGWLHHANGDRGVVMCAAMGYEALCAHQSWRVLADNLAAAGLPTLRFDYPGAGDSLDDADDPTPYDSWRRSIKEATVWMRETLGVQEIVLIGFRIGATLAAEAGGASHLVQLAPVVKGSAYLRELRILSRMLAERESGPRERGASENEINLEGFTTNASLLSAIKNIDLTDLSVCPARRVLIMTEGSARHVEDYAARLVDLGATVDTMTLNNYEALAPARAPRPAPMSDFERIVAWARSGARPKPKPAPPPPAGILRGGFFTEQAVRFGEGGSLAGVLCAPNGGKAKSLVLLLNTGANYHIGSGRSFVDCARSLAAKGVASLRMDSLGIGDSDPVEQGARSVLYREARHADVFRALDWACENGFSDFYLAGVCSGATQAFLSAVKDSRIKGAVLGNIQVFTNLRDEAAIEAHLSLALGATSTYVAKAMSLRTWARVLTSEIALSKLLAIIAGVLRRNGAAYWTKMTTGAFGSISARGREAYAHFETLSARGARVIVFHGDADAGLEELAICFGPNARRLRALPGVRLTTIPGLDHAFSSMRARKLLTDEIAALVGATSNSNVVSLPSAQPTTSCSMPPFSPDATGPEAVICVPTFRRPEMLRATLESLVAQQTSVAFAVVVVDNDAEAKEGLGIARAFFGGERLKGFVATEDRQGNVHAINAAFGMARIAFPAAEYFLMIDDDEVAAPIWLDQMIDAARRGNADVVGGPVFPIFPADVKAAFRDHPVYWPTYSKTGPVPMIYGTGNCLITRRVFEGLANASFDPAFNFLGGGDTEFFTRCRKAGFKFHWCHEASINEQVTPNRLTLGWVLRRSIATGVINYRIDRLAAQSLVDRARLAAKNIAVAPISLQRAAQLLAAPKHPFAALHPIGVAVGRWLASFGLDPQPYRRRAPGPNSPR